ncbi:MAG: sporulation integral membrane protein YtvI [Clostridia bacterium]|nr:sporulation integral membrane protein YtvI [Clostridia bacterium]
MKFLREEPYGKTLYISLCVLVISALAYLFFKYAVFVVLPFIIAWLVAAVLQRPVVFAEKKLKIPKKLSAAVLVITVILTLLAVIFALITFIIRRGGEVMTKISADGADVGRAINAVSGFIGGLFEKIGLEYDEKTPDVVYGAIESVVSSAASAVTGAAAGIASAVPEILLFTAALAISSVYFCADYRKISDLVLSRAPKRVALTLSTLKKEFCNVMTKYVRSYFLLFLLTLGELFLGLTLIGVDGAFFKALATAFVDFLPVLGTGAVLVPWAAVKLVTGEIGTGIGLLLVYLAVSAVRQIVEPRIVGKGIGLHPAVSLMTMYVGYKAFGFIGLICAPITFTIVKNTVATVKKAGVCE